ncbi:unnamed protein product [Protopolystoma xenopodis]|uniref:Uncharacterized protein n=1 Tax=Protopolystoma xenopodis TaxID=117903 RepID=A0A3S5A2P6_9PLAT|nr:unnamed protein product [Protopolystoma xenopodis]
MKSSKNALSLQEMTGILIIMFVGAVVSLVLGLLECLLRISFQSEYFVNSDPDAAYALTVSSTFGRLWGC